MEEYCDVIEYSGKPSDTLCTAGKWYTFIILLINNVLLLNLVIALLSDTYAKYEDKQLGLYYEVLVGNSRPWITMTNSGQLLAPQPL